MNEMEREAKAATSNQFAFFGSRELMLMMRETKVRLSSRARECKQGDNLSGEFIFVFPKLMPLLLLLLLLVCNRLAAWQVGRP